MVENRSRRRWGYAARIQRSLSSFMFSLFNDKAALKEDIREIGIILMTAGLIAAALDHGKFFDRATLPGGVVLLALGMILWVIGHYGDLDT